MINAVTLSFGEYPAKTKIALKKKTQAHSHFVQGTGTLKQMFKAAF